jgi:hypothetical protein
MQRSLPAILLVLASMAAAPEPISPPTYKKYLVGNAASASILRNSKRRMHGERSRTLQGALPCPVAIRSAPA